MRVQERFYSLMAQWLVNNGHTDLPVAMVDVDAVVESFWFTNEGDGTSTTIYYRVAGGLDRCLVVDGTVLDLFLESK